MTYSGEVLQDLCRSRENTRAGRYQRIADQNKELKERIRAILGLLDQSGLNLNQQEINNFNDRFSQFSPIPQEFSDSRRRVERD